MLDNGNASRLEGCSTPCYIVDEEKYVSNLTGFRDALMAAWGNVVMSYSVKTNPQAWMIERAKECAYRAEVVSDYEYEHVLRLGFSPSEIVFNGPIKGRDDFLHALRGGAVVNVDSKRELDWLEALDEVPAGAQMGVRVNINLDALCPGESRTGAEGSRFGFCPENGELAEAIRRIQAVPGLAVSGLHLHVNSQTRGAAVFGALARYAGELSARFELDLSYVDIGGGFFGGVPNLARYEEYARAIAKGLSDSFDPASTALIVEPGGAIQATPVDFVATVLDVKDVRDQRIVVTEASRVWLDPTMSKTSHRYRLELVGDDVRPVYPRQTICGFTCMDTDRLMTLEDEPELRPGDRVVFEMVGAYTFCFNPAFFIEARPRFYRASADGLCLLQDRDSLDLVNGACHA